MKVATLIQMLQKVDPELEVFQEGEEIIDVGWGYGNTKYPTSGIKEENDRIILERFGSGIR
jgi:hypothetical protein